ncbi:hypothetical protein, partial [Enterococcus faecalis]|uniref:hypothetical protein n=1 Tax=Enterococcus faecalis TaxID=1351 RepID=UPI003D6C06D6
ISRLDFMYGGWMRSGRAARVGTSDMTDRFPRRVAQGIGTAAVAALLTGSTSIFRQRHEALMLSDRHVV